MSILHGSWLEFDRALFVWGETWRSDARSDAHTAEATRTDTVTDHPSALAIADLRVQMRSRHGGLRKTIENWGDLSACVGALEAIVALQAAARGDGDGESSADREDELDRKSVV